MKKSPAAKPLPSRPVTVSAPGQTRPGPVLAIPAILIELGVDPQRAFAQAGVDQSLFDDADNRMCLEDVGRLVDTCVALTGCAHFGLLLGQRFDLATFGPLGTLMRDSPTVGEAVRSPVLHFHLHDRGAALVLLASEASCVILGYSIYRHGTSASTQVYDAAIAIGYRMLAELCGPAWKAHHVQFSHSRPRSIGPCRRVFGPSVSFEAEVSGIVFAASWMDKAIEGADAEPHGLVAKAIRDAEAQGPMSFGELVQGALHRLVLSGMASAEGAARLFAIHERTLRRRLGDEGLKLRQLISRTRFELAQQLLQNTGPPAAAIATALQDNDATAFSRAFRNWAALSPMQWRARQAIQ